MDHLSGMHYKVCWKNLPLFAINIFHKLLHQYFTLHRVIVSSCLMVQSAFRFKKQINVKSIQISDVIITAFMT